MNHLNEEQLVLHFYGDGDGQEAAHLAECAACRASYTALVQTLNECTAALPVPEPGPEFEEALWQRVAPQLPLRRRWWQLGRTWALASSMAGLLVLAFVLGRVSVRPPQPIPARASQRVLLVALSDHLERSQMVLAELVNTDPERGLPLDLERERAADLVDENRLFRQTALKHGDRAVADVLDDLERVLLTIANGPNNLRPGELEELQKRIDEQGILFKIRVLGSNVREKGLAL